MKRTCCIAILAMILVFALSATAAAETAVTSFYPIWLLTLNLTHGIEDITVHNLAAPETGCLHDYQLTGGDLKALSTADLFLINGAGMESYLDTVFEAFPELAVADASEGIELMANPEGSETPYNAHIWLDPSKAIAMAANLAEAMSKAWPQHATAIASNLDALTERLTQLDTELAEGLSGLSRHDIVTFHEAFPYFAAAYGLNVAAVVNAEPGETLSPAALAGLIETVKALGNPPLFTEPQYSDLNARTIAAETGAPVFTLDPIVTGPTDPAEALTYYDQVMRQNMNTLKEALQ